MIAKQRRFVFYIIVFALSFLMALLGVMVSVKTVSLNDRILILEAELHELQIQNDFMQYQLLSQIRLDRLDQVAVEKLHMQPVKEFKDIH